MTIKLKNKISEDDAILNSLGMLEEKEKELFGSRLKSADKNQRELVKEYNNLTSLLLISTLNKSLSPEPSAKDKLLGKIKQGKQPDATLKDRMKNFEFILSGSSEWTPHPEINGIKVKPLSFNEEKGYLMILLKAAAGSEYPSHHHSGAEECYVIEGDLLVEGKHLGPGDFHHAEGGSDHDPLRTKNGCTLLLVVDPRDY